MDYTIKQMMPIPEGYDVYVKAENDDGEMHWEDYAKYGWAHVLALIEEDDMSYISVYSFPPDGIGSVDETSKMVKRMTCPNCKEVMKIKWMDNDIPDYYCDCEK